MVNFKLQNELRGLLKAEKMIETEEVMYGRGIDGGYYKATIVGDKFGNWWSWFSVNVDKYTGCFDDGPGGYTDWEIGLNKEEWKKWSKMVKWTEEEDEGIYGEKMELITRVFGSLLTGQSVSPEDLDRL